MMRMPRMASIIAIILVAMLLAVPVSPAAEDSEAIAPIVIYGGLVVGGIIIGTVVGWMANDYLTDNDGPVYDEQKLAAELREEQAAWITSSIADAALVVGTSMDMTTETWHFTNSYWERQAEVAVADQWSVNSTMDVERILEISGLRTNATITQYNWAMVAEAVPNKYSDVLETYQDVNTYGSMRIGLMWDDGQFLTDGTMSLNIAASTVVSGPSDDRVFIDNRSSMFVLGGNARIESDQGAYVLTVGENNISAIPSGIYELQTDRMYLGGLGTVLEDDAADINAGISVMTATDTIGIMSSDDGYVIWNGADRYLRDSFDYVVKYDTDSYKYAGMTAMLTGYQNLLDGIQATAVRAYNAAQVMWMVFDTAGESTSLLSPSAIMPNLENMNLTAEQQYLVYLSALQQIGDWYYRSSDNMTLDDLSVTPQSLELVCRGAIYDADDVQITDADSVWTPIVYLRDQPVSVGSSVWTQTGLIMVWGTADSLTDWESDGMAMRLIEVSSGYSFNISEMQYQGNDTEMVVLEIMSYTEWAEIPLTPLPDTITPPQSVSIYMIIAIAALLVAVAFVSGRYKGNKAGKSETTIILKDARVRAERQRLDRVRRK